MVIKDVSGKVIFEGDNLSGANLAFANLKEADLSGMDLSYSNLTSADLFRANLVNADLSKANLPYATLFCANLEQAILDQANLFNADLERANLERAILISANLGGANLERACLIKANLEEANLGGANLEEAVLIEANVVGANLQLANLEKAYLEGVKGLVKIMGVEVGNYYWKRFNKGLNNNGYQFKVGLNILEDKRDFADDERVLCSYPGLHFGSRSWCKINYPERPLEALIQIPEGARINEPWATDGKASADRILIIRVFDTKTGEDVTEQYR